MKGRTTTSTTSQSEDQRELFETTDIRTQDDKSWASSTIYLPPPLAFFSIPSMASSWWLKLFSLLPFVPEHYCNRLINMQRQEGSDQEKLSRPSSIQEYLRIVGLRTLCTPICFTCFQIEFVLHFLLLLLYFQLLPTDMGWILTIFSVWDLH